MEVVRLLDADPDLAEALPEAERRVARLALLAPAVTLEPGDWAPRHNAEHAADGRIGVLIVSGVICRELVIGKVASAELLGPGDVIRPWDRTADHALVPYSVRWQVLEQSHLALLGPRFSETAARWPTLMSALFARAARQSHALALSAAVACTSGLETRLLMLFWQLADRWGRVTADGVVVPVALTQETVGRLVGARRPSVSSAMKQLERDGRLVRMQRGEWLLSGRRGDSEAIAAAVA